MSGKCLHYGLNYPWRFEVVGCEVSLAYYSLTLPFLCLPPFRNNLTILDVVLVHGQGGRGEMRFSNKKVGSAMPLLFDMTEKHLKSCDSKYQP